MESDLVGALADLKEDEALAMVQARLDAGDDPLGIFDDARRAMEIVGERFSASEYFIPELVYAGEILKEVAGLVKPRMAAGTEQARLGKIVLGTVAGDIHDIGKDIVASMMGIAGFDVVDLGVDVAIPTVVQKVRECHPQILGLSGLLTIAFDSMKATVAAVAEAGVRDQVKIMVGGAPVNEDVCAYVGADGWGKDAVAAVQLAKSWVGGA